MKQCRKIIAFFCCILLILSGSGCVKVSPEESGLHSLSQASNSREENINSKTTNSTKTLEVTPLEGLPEFTSFNDMAKAAYSDFLGNFWEGDPDTGYFINCNEKMVWEYGMALLGLETLYNANKDPEIKKYFAAQWAHMQDVFTDEEITTPGREPNVACDDAAWTAMTLMAIHRMTDEEKPLTLAARTILNSYEYWKDESLRHGVWYRLGNNGTAEKYDWSKSGYCAGLILTALEFHEITQGSYLAVPELYSDTLILYNWVENHLRRDGRKTFGIVKSDVVTQADDKLYYLDYTDNKITGTFQPRGLAEKIGIGEAGSSSALFFNTAMAVINIKLFGLSNEKICHTKAIETTNALKNSSYNNNGVLLNDRDAWTNAAFIGYFVNEVLTQEAVDEQVIALIRNTAISIAQNCRTEEGFYAAEWSGGDVWSTGNSPASMIMTTATTVHMIYAAALAEALGLIEY